MREKLRKQRGTPVFIYEAKNMTLLYIFDSKQDMINFINIDRNTLNNCLDLAVFYLGTFLFTLEKIDESINMNLLNKEKFKTFVIEERNKYKIKHPNSKLILA